MWNVVWLLGCLFRHSNVTQVILPQVLDPTKQGYGHSPINEKKENVWDFTKKVVFLDTNDHECDVHIYVSKCGLSIGDLWKPKMVFSHFKHNSQLLKESIYLERWPLYSNPALDELEACICISVLTGDSHAAV